MLNYNILYLEHYQEDIVFHKRPIYQTIFEHIQFVPYPVYKISVYISQMATNLFPFT